jgi:hypothetical protein
MHGHSPSVDPNCGEYSDAKYQLQPAAATFPPRHSRRDIPAAPSFCVILSGIAKDLTKRWTQQGRTEKIQI